MTNEISLNEGDEDRLQELVSDYVSESPKSRTESLVRKFGFMDISELSLNSLEDFSYYCVTRMNGKGKTRDLLEYLIKKDPSTWNVQQYYGFIEKYSLESEETTSKENLDIKEPKNSEQKQTREKVISQKARDKKRTLTPAQKTWMWENKSRICIICKKEVKKQSDAHYDHIKPHVKGEKTIPAKMAITHALCNRLKGKKSLRQIQKELGTSSKVKIKRTVKKLVANNIGKIPFGFTLEKFFENGNEYVRILHPNTTVEACLILCNKEPCKWWDDGGILPSHIRSGGGGNVLLPENAEDSNPMITVMSGKRAIRKMKLKDIVLTHP